MATCDPREIEGILRSDTSGLRDRIVRSLGDFTVALFGISGRPNETLRFAGTGTLVLAEGRHFILTALHVWEEVLKSADRIGITMKENVVHRTVIERGAVVPDGPPKPKAWSEWGPDIVLLSVPTEDVGRISAYRSFWNLAGRVDVNAEVLEVRILMGTPAALGTITETNADLQIHGMFLGPETLQTESDFDYLDYEIDHSLPGVPQKLGGVSGGGVWQVYLYWAEEKVDWKMSLHGVAFYGLQISAKNSILRCHGPISIHKTLAYVPTAR
jgi:hypothetical protein